MSDNSHFKRFTAFRPRNIDPSMPHYAPDRDFSQVSLWLAKIQSMIRSGDAEYWVRTLHSLEPADGEELGDRLGQAYLEVVAFLEDAAGADIVGDRYGTEVAEASGNRVDESVLPSYESSLKKLLWGSEADLDNFIGESYGELSEEELDDLTAEFLEDEENDFCNYISVSKLVLLAMLGVVSLNGLFYTIRQDRLLGRVGPMTFDEMWPLLAHVSTAVLTGRTMEEEAKNVLRNAAAFAKATGLSDALIEDLVRRELCDRQ